LRLPRLPRLFEPNVVGRTRAAHRSTIEWMEAELSAHVPERRLVIRSGDLVEEAAIHAKSLNAGLIVLPPADFLWGSTVTSMARAAGCPVLVAREGFALRTILAATDMQHPDFPVLRCAGRLGRRADGKVIALHNIAPLAVMAGGVLGPRVAVAYERPTPVDLEAKLVALSPELGTAAAAIVRSEHESAHAIVDEARRQNAGLIVVGTHYRTWWQRVLGSSVAAGVVSRTERCVLVTPVGERVASASRRRRIQVVRDVV
jgi:nucleotide-binding universal stress UspA family protein